MNAVNELLYAHLHVTAQEAIEEHYSRKLVDFNISEFVKNDADMQLKREQGVSMIHEYMNGEYFPGKTKRIMQLRGLNLDQLVTDIFIGIAYCIQPVLFASVSAQLANRLGFSDKTDAIATVAELIAVLCRTDVFDITKADKMASLMVISRIPLSKELLVSMEESQYLPPMVCKPAKLINNLSSGYLTHSDSLILGNGNHHQGDICLDTLNLMNSVALSLNEQFLETVEEVPTFNLDTQDKVEQWNKFKDQSANFYSLLIKHGNEFYLTHKVDKRGRAYAQGYHINTQGNAYKKAAIELAHKEIVTGVPN